MYDGGLEQVTITMTDRHRGMIKLGNKRLLDIVTSDNESLAVFKEKGGGSVKVRADDLLNALKKLTAS